MSGLTAAGRAGAVTGAVAAAATAPVAAVAAANAVSPAAAATLRQGRRKRVTLLPSGFDFLAVSPAKVTEQLWPVCPEKGEFAPGSLAVVLPA
jgi:hypothetical protein